MTDENHKQLPLFEADVDSVSKSIPHAHSVSDQDTLFSKCIVHVDESGDYSLQSIDDQPPIFVLAFCVFYKRELKKQSEVNSNPYHIALGLCMDTLYDFLQEKDQHNKKIHVVVECRGRKEDGELELNRRSKYQYTL